MKFPLTWLKEYIDIDMPPQQIAKSLILSGIEVDDVEKMSLGFSKVVVAKVLEVNPHPNADKLCLAKVSDGLAAYDVVCGAPNCRAGMKTAFAPIGAALIDEQGQEFKVKKAKIRGVESSGMLCSGKELGISQDADGIVEFAEYLKEGSEVADIYADTLFEVSLTPNLSHAASLVGMARELAAASTSKAKLPTFTLKETGSGSVNEIKATVQDFKEAPRYSCRIIEDVKVGPSPSWLVERLHSCGLRSVNNVVDVTNYVFIELGQPLHAFDFDKLAGHEIQVRQAKEGETITTLDGKKRILTPEMLLIADRDQPIAIAGVMGSKDSEVTENTHKIVLESAYFRPGSIRRTSKQLSLLTDSSKKFERGIDPNNVLFALDRAAALIAELGQGQVCKGFLDLKAHDFPQAEIKCRLSRTNALLGTHLSVSEVESIFQRLNFGTVWDGQDTFSVKVPTYRVDISQEVDLIEEVARIFGYDNIPRHSAIHHASDVTHSPIYLFEREIRQRLISEGLQEFLTCDLIGPSILEIAPDPNRPAEDYVKVLNPTSIEQSILRTSLLPGLLQLVKYNMDNEMHHISGFEVGKIHFKRDSQYKEQTVAGLILTGKSGPHHIDPKPHVVDFYDLKGIIENLLKGLNIKRYSFKASNLPTFHSGRQAVILVDSHEVGSLGEVHPAIQRHLDVPQRMLFAEINLHDLFKASRVDLKMQPIPRFPSSERDWTVTIKEQMPLQQLLGSIQRIPSALLEEVSWADTFRSEKLGHDVKNVTLHFVYRKKDETVSQSEVDAEHERIISAAQHMLEAFK